MVYKFLRVLVGYALRIYYRKIYIEGLDNFPLDQPVILSCNHPDGFTEPLLLACFLPRPLHFLVRGDVFENPFLKPLLLATNQIPIYRVRDGFANLRNNHHTFRKVTEKLQENAAILIFTEGSTERVKHIRPLQKGMAKMAFNSYLKGDLEQLAIVPVSMYYVRRCSFRSEVMISIGESISLHKYSPVNKENIVQLIGKLTEETEQAMQKLLPGPFPDRINYAEENAGLAYIFYPYKVFPIVATSEKYLRREAECKYLKMIEANAGLNAPRRNIVYGSFTLLLGMLPAIIAFILHLIPLYLTHRLAMILANHPIFLNAIRLVVGMVVILIYYGLCLLIGYGFFPDYLWVLLGLPLGMVYLVIFDSYHYKVYTSSIHQR